MNEIVESIEKGHRQRLQRLEVLQKFSQFVHSLHILQSFNLLPIHSSVCVFVRRESAAFVSFNNTELSDSSSLVTVDIGLSHQNHRELGNSETEQSKKGI